MISEFDIWRSANVLIKRYGEDAAFEAAAGADDMLESGKIEGERIWLRILHAVEELQRRELTEGEALH